MAKRSDTKHPLFGHPNTLKSSEIPSYHDVFRYILFVKKEMQNCNPGRWTKDSVYKKVTDDVLDIWSKFSFPTITKQRVYEKIENFDKMVDDYMKNFKRKDEEAISSFMKPMNDMLDLSPCHCYDKGILRKDCSCKVKIPLREWDSYVNQKKRIGILGGVDLKTTAINQRKHEKEIKKQEFQTKEKHNLSQQFEVVSNSEEQIDDLLENKGETDDDFFIPGSIKKENQYNTYAYNNLAVSADRYGLSDTATAAVGNAILKEICTIILIYIFKSFFSVQYLIFIS